MPVPVNDSASTPKPPRLVLPNIYAFPPNRATLGATAYFIVEKDAEGNPANILIDTPAWNPATIAFLENLGGVHRWVITHRGGIGEVKPLQSALECPVCVQEQEAYLLPDIPQVNSFGDRCDLSPTTYLFWTPGHSPGSACLYTAMHGGVLFTGRHLLPDRTGHITPLRFSKTFHWPRQLRQVDALRSHFSPATLAYLCPAANTGFLRGQAVVADAYTQLKAIDVEALRRVQPIL